MAKGMRWTSCAICRLPFYPVTLKQGVCLECLIRDVPSLIIDNDLRIAGEELYKLSRRHKRLYDKLFGAAKLFHVKHDLLFLQKQVAEAKLQDITYRELLGTMTEDDYAFRKALTKEVDSLDVEIAELLELGEVHVDLIKKGHVTTASLRKMLNDTDGSVIPDEKDVTVEDIENLL